MTDHIDPASGADGPAATDGAQASAEFEDEVRRMLRRRAADVPDERPEAVGSALAVIVAADSERPAPDAPVVGVESVVGVLAPIASPVRWHRRAGVLAAVAAVVIAVVGIGVANWVDDDQQLAVGGPAADGPTVLVPPEGDPFTLQVVDVAPPEEPPAAGFTAIEYGPVDGELADGVAVIVEEATDRAAIGGTAVTPDQNAILADLGAVFEGPAVIWWHTPEADDGTRSSVTVLWSGRNVTLDHGLAVAASVAADPGRELDGESLPPGWATRSVSVIAESGAPTTMMVFDGPWSAVLTSFTGELPFALWVADFGDQGASTTAEEKEVRGGAGVLVGRTIVDEDGSPAQLDALVWHENGATHRLGLTAPTDEAVDVNDLVGLADRLVAVDLDEARRRTGQDPDQPDAALDGSVPQTATTVAGSTGTIGDEVNPETVPPPSLTTTGPSLSLTAPGPGAIEGTTATTGADGQTTVPDTVTTDQPVLSTEGENGSIVTFTMPEPLVRPNGEFLANAIVSVATGAVGDQSYEVGVVWSPTFGLCMGIDLDGAITEGGFPVECELEPGVGGGGSRIIPDEGVIVFAFADATTTAATVWIGGVTEEADVYRVPEFPEFSLLVFTFEDAPAEMLADIQVPGGIDLFDQAGQPVGWG